jgi:hypothetical protein
MFPITPPNLGTGELRVRLPSHGGPHANSATHLERDAGALTLVRLSSMLAPVAGRNTMALFWGRVGRMNVGVGVLLGLLADCSSTNVSDAGVTNVDAAVDVSAKSVCVTNDDCVVSSFDRPVTSAHDCYCQTECGSSVTTSMAVVYRDEWLRFCPAWEDASQCIAPPCVPVQAQCSSAGQCEVRQ